VPWAASELPKGAVLKISDIEGRGVIYPIAQDELVLESKLAATGAGAGLPSVIPHGMRAVSIRVDDVVAVAGFVGPGTRVDVLLTGSPTTKNDTALTKTILQNVQVLAAGQKIQPDSQGRAEKVNVVTLLCTGQDAAKVTLAANEGRIQLILRNPTDTQSPERAASVGKSALYGETVQPVTRVVHVPVKAPAPPPVVVAAPPPPPPPDKPAPPPSIVLIRSGNVTTVQVTERKGEVTNQ
jgi:pilus assembly protein CpaB